GKLGIHEGPQLDESIQRDSWPRLCSQTLTNVWTQHPFRYGQLPTVRQSHNHNRSIASAPQITNPFDFYSVTWVIAVTDLGGIQTMSSTKIPYATASLPICWSRARICVPSRCFWDTAA